MLSAEAEVEADITSCIVLKTIMTNTPSHETQTDIENHALRSQPKDYSIISKKIIDESVVTVTIYCKHWLRYFSGCVSWRNS